MSEFDDNLEARAALFKALGHPVRLLLMSLIQLQPRHGEELAAILHLDPATISHHIAKLTEVGLLEPSKDQYYQVYSLTGKLLDLTIGQMAMLPQPDLVPNVELDAYRKKVLRAFYKQGRLLDFPSQVKKQRIVLEKIVEEFEVGHDYSERDVNQVLLDFHDDVATLRRGLIEHGLMVRVHGVYHRMADEDQSHDASPINS
ncbi:MAG: DUF2087 domain-containing protein [Anaerolineae bacterium]|nr:DUF2087 domain-containing protein [Anaerolineae bacterium]